MSSAAFVIGTLRVKMCLKIQVIFIYNFFKLPLDMLEFEVKWELRLGAYAFCAIADQIKL